MVSASSVFAAKEERFPDAANGPHFLYLPNKIKKCKNVKVNEGQTKTSVALSPAKGKAVKKTAQRAKQAKGWPAGVRDVRYPATIDKSQQPTLLYVAKAKEKRPLLVGLHTWSRDYKKAKGTGYAKWCIKNDWHFVHPHFRGPNNTPQACGSEMVVQDIIDVVEFMKKNYQVDEDRIYLVGTSGGGYAAILLAGRAPDIWAGVSSWVPISDIRAWWEQGIKSKNTKYAKHIEKAVGGRPDKSEKAAKECVKRSAVTYLSAAKGVNLDINAGVHDGRKGSVPFTHSLYAFNAVVDKKDQIDSKLVEEFYQKEVLPAGLKKAAPDPLYGDKKTIFRKVVNNTRVTIFEGGHDIVCEAALTWLAAQRKGKPAVWQLNASGNLKTTGDTKADK